MLNLFDYLTEEDNRKIENYIYTYAIDENSYTGNKNYLSYWADNNKKLFHLLGGNLIYKVPYEYAKSEDIIKREISDLLNNTDNKNVFYIIYDFLKEKTNGKWSISYYFNRTSIYLNNKIPETLELNNNSGKILKIPQGCKVIRALQKILTYYNASKKEFDALEKFRIELSMITNDKKIKGNLCFSIHPLDFITMSDNSSNWQSCMSWKDKGCYRLGTVEMMNSNNVICVYIDNDKKTFEYGEGNHKDTWNNKRWRQLFYCTKEIIVSGKSYPYYNEKITQDALGILRTLALKNWHRTYEYGIERYQDMIHLGSLYRIENNRYWIRSKTQAKKHNIIFDSKAMYNDMFNDNTYESYWCVRNKVKKNTIISYSGKAPCLCCMETVTTPGHQYDDYSEDSYNIRYNNADSLICSNCLNGHMCNYCSNYSKDLYKVVENTYYCKRCWEKKVRECPLCHKAMSLDLLSSSWKINISDFYICNNCLSHFEDFSISKWFDFFTSKWANNCWRYKKSDDEKYPEEFENYSFKNLKMAPLPVKNKNI